MSAPNFIVTELKTDSGQVLSVFSATPKTFKTGSRGFYARQILEIGGKRYQVQVQLVEKGSKNTAKSSDE
ncbi:MAG: hypothetical protein A2Z16_00815 [Chloroflexi bacterium RBG_16_54_18]|nr:MAG: hypothetical protein A2Z16_00815 [Chloroflexi bacterium RBG_16_54_18]